MMTKRVNKMIESLRINQYPLCVEQFRLANESLEKTGGQPMLLRRSKLHAHVLDNINVFIEEDDLLCGSGASKPFGLEMQYEYGVWTREEVESLKSEIYTIAPEDEEELYRLNDKFSKNSLNSNLIEAMGKSLGENERLWPFMKSGCILPPWKDKKGGSGGGFAMSGYGLGPGFSLVCIDYSRILQEGAKSIINEAKECLNNLRYDSTDSIEKRNYWEGVIIVFEAWVRFAKRYAAMAEKMASEEKDEARKAELLEMARVCNKVPYEPAETFYEALQSFWFTFLLVCPSPTSTAGRFDQYMYPFYKKDIEEGRISDDKVLELLEIMRCKVMKINRVSGKANRAKNSGMAKWYNWTIGGQKADGSDATNELSYLLLEAAIETHLPHHTITLRVHAGTPEKIMTKALECVKSGIGLPAFIGDKSFINFFVNQSETNRLTVEEARDYVPTGCVDGNIPGITRTQVATFFVVPQAMDICMHNGVCRYTNEMVGKSFGDVTKMDTFEEFKHAVFEETRYLMTMANERINVELITERELFPDVFRSALMKDGVKEGKDMYNRRFSFENGAVLGAVGGVNTGNSLYAIKRLVYDQKKYSMKQLIEALDANWIGYEKMQQDFKTQDKYGNNITEVDQMVAEVYKTHADVCLSLPCAYGDTLKPNAISISAHQPGGECTGATADGRKGGEILADASLSPEHGTDKSGPLAAFMSAMKVNQDAYQGTLMNMKILPDNMKTENDLKKLGSMIKTYLTNGGKHIQFNIINQEEMLDAKEHPQSHSDLVVRVAGYSAYFTKLTTQIQDEVIERTSHTMD
ncbi:pyruvate formate lyase family protein [Clostridium sp. E02]|uniref:pyruvate formate lyase family protein n=1 Tax=Clostridium sp. E02 TaxID=2487134 RepID=UPI0013DD8B15|nr:pyruvate formate lyase family protein [Clostridium sp. E02]